MSAIDEALAFADKARALTKPTSVRDYGVSLKVGPDGVFELLPHLAVLASALRASMERERAKDEALLWAWEMFRARDEMNAKVHCAPVRYSPITERCRLALAVPAPVEEKK